MFRNYLTGFILFFLPKTRCFKLKVALLNLVGCEIAQSARITGDIKIYGRGKIIIGSNTWIGLGCHFYTSAGTSIVIGDNCDVAPEVVFHTGTHAQGGTHRRAGPGRSASIEIGNGSWVGLGAKLLSGAVVGSGSIVAAGAIVLGYSHLNNMMLAGTPARPVKELDAT